jgi:hypothetical protein
VIIKIDNCGQGFNSDLTPEELGTGVWTNVQNMRFRNGYAERFRGTSAAFTTPSVTPYFVTPYATTSARYWIHAGLTSVFADDGTTKTDITGTAKTGAIDDRWTGGSINGVLVLNNGVDNPMYWGGTGTLATLPGWDATNWKCTSMRPFKNFLIALGMTKTGTKYPHMVKWCTTLNPGSITAVGDWTETDPSKDAGEQDLAETPDILVDCLPLGDVNIIFKERSTYAMTYVGAPYIFRFQRLPGDSGMLARGCGVQTPLGLVVLSAGDVMLHTGGQPQSIANGIVRDYIFKNIDSANYKRAFVTANPQKSEVWICFPYGSSTTCNTACVWNWESKAWGIRSLTNVTYGAFGQFNLVNSSATWAGDASTWNTDATTWNENEYSPAEARLVMCHSTPYISLQDTGSTDFGSLITANLERTGIGMDDPNTVKTMTGIRPRIDGPIGTQVNIQMGASMYPDATPTWGTAQTFTVGTSLKIDGFATGRFLAVRFTNVDYGAWRMKSFDIDVVPSGAY